MNPFQPWRSSYELWALMAQANTVITLRLLGMAGVLKAAPSENHTMMSEKGPAFAESAMAAGAAALMGQSPDKVMQAAIRPLKRRTTSNVRRLTKARRPS